MSVSFDGERSYQAAMAIAKSMLASGIISDADYLTLQSFFLSKYQPVFDLHLSVNPSLTGAKGVS